MPLDDRNTSADMDCGGILLLGCVGLAHGGLHNLGRACGMAGLEQNPAWSRQGDISYVEYLARESLHFAIIGRIDCLKCTLVLVADNA